MKSSYNCPLNKEILRGGGGGRALAVWLVILDRSGCFPHLSEELKLPQLPAAQVTLAVELNPYLG